MAHELSIQNGKAEMFSGNNVVPWHKLGTVVSGLLTAAEAIKAAHLDWTVKPMPISCNGIQLPFPNGDTADCWQGIVREDTGATLGVMRGRYETIQNKECFDFMDSLVSDGKLSYETAGALRGGKQVWMMAKYDGDLEINKDKHNQWLLLVSSHDGSYSLMVQWITERVVCANTLSIALKGATNQVKIRHTKTWEDKATEAKRILGLTENYFAKMQATLAGMNTAPITPEAAQAFTKLLFPAKDEKDVPTRTSNMRWGVERLFNRGAGNNGNSRWDMLNAVTDFADHHQTLRGPNSTRLESSLLGSGAVLKQKAFEYLTSEAIMADLLNKPHTTSQTTGSDFSRLINQ